MKEKSDSGLTRVLNNEVRKLKAIITLIIYGLLLLLLKTMYDTLVKVPRPSIVAIIILLAFMLVFSVIMFNRFSSRAIKKITEYAAAIQEARIYAERIVDSVPNPLLVLDADFRIRTANPAFLERFGYSKEETSGKNLFEFDGERWNLPELRSRMANTEKELQDFHQLELEFSDMQAGNCHLLVGGRKVVVEGADLYLLSLEDVTPRKMAEIALKDRTLQLEVVNRAKSEFLANMSHELRTPLNAVIGFSEVLKDGLVDGDLTSRQKEYVSDIFSSGKHLLSLINDILDLSKIESGKMTLDLEPVDVSGLCISTGRVIKEKASIHGIELSFDIQEALDAIYLDIRKFRQIAYNLLSNAVKFTPDQGRVKLSAKRVSAQDMFTAYPQAAPRWQGEHFLEIKVEDTGIGISEEDQARLFQPFEQIDGSLSRKYEGTGLGLTMVKRLTELHGGWVTMFSRKGEGSTFSVFLPWRREKAEAEEKKNLHPGTGPEPEASEKSSNLLLVSRRSALRNSITQWAEQSGVRLESLPSYGRAWEYLNQNTPDMVFLDADYPGLDGIRMLMQVKGLSRFTALPMVLLVDVPEGNQGAILAPSAICLSPLNPESLTSLLHALGLNARTPSDPPRRAMLVEADGSRAQSSLTALSGMGWIVDHREGGLAGVDGMVQNVPDVLFVGVTQPDISGFEILQLLAERPETRSVPTVMIFNPQTVEQDLEPMRRGLFAILRKSGINSVELQKALNRVNIKELS